LENPNEELLQGNIIMDVNNIFGKPTETLNELKNEENFCTVAYHYGGDLIPFRLSGPLFWCLN